MKAYPAKPGKSDSFCKYFIISAHYKQCASLENWILENRRFRSNVLCRPYITSLKFHKFGSRERIKDENERHQRKPERWLMIYIKLLAVRFISTSYTRKFYIYIYIKALFVFRNYMRKKASSSKSTSDRDEQTNGAR